MNNICNAHVDNLSSGFYVVHSVYAISFAWLVHDGSITILVEKWLVKFGGCKINRCMS